MEDKSRGQRCGDIKLVDYLTDDVGSVPLVLDLLIEHERWRSSLNPSLNVQLHYPRPTDIVRPLNTEDTDKIREYFDDYNRRPSNSISFRTSVPSTSGRLHCELVRIFFLQDHRERPLTLFNPDNQFHYRHTESYSQFKSEVCLLDLTLTPHTLKPLVSYPRPYRGPYNRQ